MTQLKKNRLDDEEVLEIEGDQPHLTEAGEEAQPSRPLRTCIAERRKAEKSLLLRFVLSPQGEVVPDIAAKLPGRGVWVGANKATVEAAVKKRAFARAFKRDVKVSPDLDDNVGRLLKGAALGCLSIANKAGLVVTGFGKVEEAAKRGELIGVLHAEGAAIDGMRKIDRKFSATAGGKAVPPAKNCFTSEEISLATGNIGVIHAGLKEGGASRAFLNALERWSKYCAGPIEDGQAPCQGKE